MKIDAELILIQLIFTAMLQVNPRRMEERGRKRPWAQNKINSNDLRKAIKNRLTLCDYYRELGLQPRICENARIKQKSRRLPNISTTSRALIKIMPEVDSINFSKQFKYEGVGNYPSCQGFFAKCHSSDNCLSGILCRNPLTETKCCKLTSFAPQCPSTEKLGYSCLQKNPVNWCNLNTDCATNLLHSHICCPTGCGYNVCVSNLHFSQPARRILMIDEQLRQYASDCPNPLLVRLSCVVPRPTSLCNSARECPTYEAKYPRRCCLSACGYNVCLTKFEDGWIIA